MIVLKDTTAYRQQLRTSIMNTALMDFAQRGIKAVKMDDIAKELSISKRTLYEIFEDKETLLFESIRVFNQKRQKLLEDYVAQGNHDVLDIILEVYRMKLREIRKINPTFYNDIMKYPNLVQFIKDNNERSREKYYAFMQRGVDEGLLRPDVNYHMIPHMMDAIVQHILRNDFSNSYSIEEIFSNSFLVVLRGLCTQKGIQRIDEVILR